MRHLTTLILLFVTLPLLATTYYLDATNGSNANDGLSEATAWKDLFKIRASLPQPGDVYLFKRGESWSGNQLYITASGTAGNPIRYAAYGSGDRPIVSIIAPVDGADDPGNWTSTSPGTWTLALARTPGRLYLDGAESLRSSTLATLGLADNEGAIGRWFYAGGVLYMSSAVNPALAFAEITGSKFFNSAQVFGASFMEFENLDIRGGSGASFSINGGSDILLTACTFGRFANSGVTVIDATISDVYTPSARIIVEGSRFDSDFTFFYGLGSERGCGDGIKLFYGASDCVVRNDTFLNWAHNAIELLANQPGGAGVNNNVFHDNRISAPDIPYAHPFGTDGFLGKCQFNEFYRNYVTDCRTASQINGNDNHTHHNIIVGMRKSPSKTQATAHAFSIGIYGNYLVSQNNRFDHNLIIDTDESAFLIRGYSLPGQAFGHQIRNNIIYNTGLDPYVGAYAAGTGIVIFDTADNGVGPNTYQNNLFFSSDPTAKEVYVQDDDAYYTSAEFNALNGTDGNTIADNIATDPQFNDFGAGDYFPAETSPLIDAGISTGLPLDYALNPRETTGTAPDIGPFETDYMNLPVTWADFSVRRESPKNLLLSWATHTELNADKFIIERSRNADQWQAIGEVLATGNTNRLSQYHYKDTPPESGTWYYRLRQLDHDGRALSSPVRTGALAEAVGLSVARVDQHTFRVSSATVTDWSGTDFSIYDANGRLLLRQGGNPVITVGSLPAGALFLVVEFVSGRRETVKLVH